ncbi:hypothetical protein NKH18_14890 [Streptomyces sp. M10(2022)]
MNSVRSKSAASAEPSPQTTTPQRPAQNHINPTAHLVQGLGEHRIRRSKLRTHPRTLCTLTREQETRPTRDQARARLFLSE